MDRIISKKKGSKPRYVIGGFNSAIREIFYYLKLYEPDDIFVLSPSVRNQSQCKKIANYMSKKKKPVYVPNSDDEMIKSDVLKGKICFSTFHQVKGLERKVIIIINFDSSYFTYYGKDLNDKIFPNILYVASTRSLEKISYIRNVKKSPFKFINEEIIDKYVDIIRYK